jgi:hypothetical protein
MSVKGKLSVARYSFAAVEGFLLALGQPRFPWTVLVLLPFIIFNGVMLEWLVKP